MKNVESAGFSNLIPPEHEAQELGFMQAFNGDEDPVEAYFECISQCSLDDGECVTVCTTILRES